MDKTTKQGRGLSRTIKRTKIHFLCLSKEKQGECKERIRKSKEKSNKDTIIVDIDTVVRLQRFGIKLDSCKVREV